jgi:recombination protein RecA
MSGLEKALDQINKDFGAGTISALSGQPALKVTAFSTGSLNLDMALGVGGIPSGRVVEIYGPESSGKTTVALHAIASAQKIGKTCAFIDVEHAIDPTYARALGVDTDALLVTQPDNAQDALNIVERLTQTGEVGLIVLDSVAALVPRQELQGEIGDAHVGLLARIMSQALRIIVGSAAKTDTTVIFINQIREKIGVMFGSPETQPGGRALKYASSVRLDVRRKESKKDGDEFVGNITKVKVVKNKVAPPYREAFFEIVFGEGISFVSEVLDMGIDLDIVTKSGAWIKYGEDMNCQGRENAKKYLVEHDETLQEIYKLVWAATHNGELPS